MSLETGGARFSAWKHASTERLRSHAIVVVSIPNGERNVRTQQSMSYGGGATGGAAAPVVIFWLVLRKLINNKYIF